MVGVAAVPAAGGRTRLVGAVTAKPTKSRLPPIQLTAVGSPQALSSLAQVLLARRARLRRPLELVSLNEQPSGLLPPEQQGQVRHLD